MARTMEAAGPAGKRGNSACLWPQASTAFTG
jgi:hypothetical protein